MKTYPKKSQQPIVIYSTENCPYCVRAKGLLNTLGISFEDIDLTGQFDEINALKTFTGWKTVPQIFIHGKLIGGFTDLAELESNGQLKVLLKGETPS